MSSPTPSPNLSWRKGLSAAASFGSQGTYRQGTRQDLVRVGSILYREGVFHRLGAAVQPAFALALPDAYSVSHESRSWSGRTTTWAWVGGGCVADLRTTLPGPRFTLPGDHLPLRWLDGCEPTRIESLTDSVAWTPAGVPALEGRRLLLALTKHGWFLLVLSGVSSIRMTSHAHWNFLSPKPGARLLIARLIHENDIPRDPQRQSAWLDLLDAPPLECEEEYAITPDRLYLRHRFPGATRSPLPPGWAAVGSSGGMFSPPSHTLHLLDLPAGPYLLASGDSWEGSLATAWMDAKLQPVAPGTPIPATELPEELAYPGDNTWRPERDVLDRLMMLRLWTPYWSVLAPETREQLRPWLVPPRVETFRASLTVVETGRPGLSWTKDASVFEESGDTSWDTDWYSGLSVSGLARGAACEDPEIAYATKALATEIRPEREQLIAYFRIHADWSTGSAWTDARGLFINTNCLQNGLEGLMGERRLRLAEGDTAGAGEITLLAARTGLSYLAYHAQAAHARRVGWANSDNGGPHFGANFLFDDAGVVPLTPATKNLYYLPSFPESAALVRAHGDLAALRQVLATWDQPAEIARRRTEWLDYYLSEDPKSFTYECERREQGALTFLTSPELIARIWILGQDPASATGPYTRPLRLPDPAIAAMRLA